MMRLLPVLLFLSATPAAAANDVTITLNDDEQKAALQLLDIAVKAGGLQVAGSALALAQKILSSAPAQPQPKEPPPATP